MLTIYRRHRRKCEQRHDRISKKCRCVLWAKGTLEGKPYQKTLKTRSWERAQQLVRKIENGDFEKQQIRISIDQAVQKFLEDAGARNLNKGTLAKYKTLGGRIKDFTKINGVGTIDEFSPNKVRDFRASWKLGARTAIKELERLRAFFRFCQDNEWMIKNPAKGIKPPQVKIKPRMPFDETEIKKILEKCQDDRERAFVLTLRHTGLRIGDTSLLSTEQFQSAENRIYLYTTKTGAPVSVVIPPQLSNLLKSLPAPGGYFFLRGNSTYMHTTTNLWRRIFKRICKDAGVYPDHAHRMRHSLAADLLVKGASVEDVAAILGNSPQIVQKHYSQFIKARQDRLDSIVSSTWTPTLVRVK